MRVNEKLLTTFLQLEETLDENVGKAIVFDIERGGIPLQLTIKVQDLHSITPDKFLEIGGAILVSF